MGKQEIPTHPSGETMKAICFTSFGKNADLLFLKKIPKPFINEPDQVLIKVHACALNPIDKIRLAGDLSLIIPEEYDTSVLGYDVSGVIEQVGKDSAKSFKVGDEVFSRLSDQMQFGALAEYVVCSVREIAKKPANISFPEAASIPLAGLTSVQAFRRGGIKEGSKIFIPGGAGGVGSLAIQIAKKMFKASYVCTTASLGVGTEICIKAGADKVIDYRSENFEEVLRGEDFDMALDITNQAAKMGDLLKEGGKIISISGTPSIEAIKSVSDPPLLVRMFMFATRNRKAEAAARKEGGTWEYVFMQPNGEELNEIAKFIESGEIKAVIDTVASSLDDFKVAVDKLWSGHSKGKCVIKVA